MQNQLWSAAPRIVNLPFQLSFTHQNNHSNLFDFLFPKPPASMSITSLLNSEFPFRLSTCCKQRCNVIASDPHLHSTCDPGTFGEVNKCTTAAKKGSKTEFSLFSYVALFLGHHDSQLSGLTVQICTTVMFPLSCPTQLISVEKWGLQALPGHVILPPRIWLPSLLSWQKHKIKIK